MVQEHRRQANEKRGTDGEEEAKKEAIRMKVQALAKVRHGIQVASDGHGSGLAAAVAAAMAESRIDEEDEDDVLEDTVDTRQAAVAVADVNGGDVHDNPSQQKEHHSIVKGVNESGVDPNLVKKVLSPPRRSSISPSEFKRRPSLGWASMRMSKAANPPSCADRREISLLQVSERVRWRLRLAGWLAG